MKLPLLLAAAVMFAAIPAYATYDESLAQCEKFAADNKTSAEPCECIAKKVGDDADLSAEQAELKTMDDFNNSSAEMKAAVEPCLAE